MLNPIVLKNLHNKVNLLNIKLLYFLRGLLTKFTVSGLQLLNKKKQSNHKELNSCVIKGYQSTQSNKYDRQKKDQKFFILTRKI